MTDQDYLRLLLQVSLMLAAALTFGQFMRLLKLPVLLGELMGGIVLGPTILGALSPNVQEYLFPMSGVTFVGREAVSKIGLLCFLFVAGLEMDIMNFRKQAYCIVTTSFLGMALPFALGFMMVFSFPHLWPLGTHSDGFLLALFMGTALSISALPAIARILIDLGLQKTKLAAVILGAATVDDIVGWTLFGCILSYASLDHSPNNPWTTIFLVVGFSILSLTLGRAIVKRVRTSFKAEAINPSLLICISAILTLTFAAIVQAFGVHGIFGAYLAGLVLSQGIEQRAPAHEIVFQMALGIFAPLYFVSIGLKANFFANFDLKLVALVLTIACIGKVVGASLGARIAGTPLREAMAIGFGLNARGAMEIVVASIAFEHGLIHERIFVSLVIMALVTTMMSGPTISRLIKAKPSGTPFSNHRH